MQNKTGFWNVSQKVWGCEDGVKRISLTGFSNLPRNFFCRKTRNRKTSATDATGIAEGVGSLQRWSSELLVFQLRIRQSIPNRVQRFDDLWTEAAMNHFRKINTRYQWRSLNNWKHLREDGSLKFLDLIKLNVLEYFDVAIGADICTAWL